MHGLDERSNTTEGRGIQTEEGAYTLTDLMPFKCFTSLFFAIIIVIPVVVFFDAHAHASPLPIPYNNINPLFTTSKNSSYFWSQAHLPTESIYTISFFVLLL